MYVTARVRKHASVTARADRTHAYLPDPPPTPLSLADSNLAQQAPHPPHDHPLQLHIPAVRVPGLRRQTHLQGTTTACSSLQSEDEAPPPPPPPPPANVSNGVCVTDDRTRSIFFSGWKNKNKPKILRINVKLVLTGSPKLVLLVVAALK